VTNAHRAVCAVRGGGCFNYADAWVRPAVTNWVSGSTSNNRDQGFRTFRPSRLPSPNQDTP